MKRCEANDEHFYDGDMFPKCPYCSNDTYNGEPSLKRCGNDAHYYDTTLFAECPSCNYFNKEFPWDLVISQDCGIAIIALSNEEIGKVISINSRDALMDEAEKLQYANAVNDLVVKYKRMDKMGAYHMLVMERVYPLHFNAYENKIKNVFMSDFEKMLFELHQRGFAHNDLGYCNLGQPRQMLQPALTVKCSQNVVMT